MAKSPEEKARRLSAHKAARARLGPQTPKPKKKRKSKKIPGRPGRKPAVPGIEGPVKRRGGQRRLKPLQEIKKYASEGQLPHEFLLAVSRGEELSWGKGKNRRVVTPSMEQRLAAAVAGASYFAPKLSQIDVREHLTEDDLMAIIASAAAAAGISISLGGTGKKASESVPSFGYAPGDGDSSVIDHETGAPFP